MKRDRRQLFVLTPEEKKTVAFVAIAFLLGLATMRYRATHHAAPRALTFLDERAAKPSAARAKRTPSEHRRAPKATPSPMPEAVDEE